MFLLACRHFRGRTSRDINLFVMLLVTIALTLASLYGASRAKRTNYEWKTSTQMLKAKGLRPALVEKNQLYIFF